MTRIVLAALFSLAAASSHAAVLVVPGIPSFNTSLGTLTSATVTIDPPPTPTSVYDASFFESIGNHFHVVAPFNATVGGLGTFSFTPTATNFVNPPSNSEHSHVVDIPASMQTFTGAGLNWFLNPANGVTHVNIAAPATSTADDHNHTISFAPVLASTLFVYTPAIVPEPTAAVLALLAAAPFLRRRG